MLEDVKPSQLTIALIVVKKECLDEYWNVGPSS